MTVPATKKSKLRILFGILGFLVFVPVAGVAVVAMIIDPDDYRTEIAQLLSEQIGRKVSLDGEMHLGFAKGLSIEINDASIANPSWASRPLMAKVGKMELSMALMPLLDKQIDIKRVALSDADVLLETGPGDKGNWEFEMSGAPKAEVKAKPDKKDEAAAPQSIELNLRELALKNVRFAMKGKSEAQIDEVLLHAMDKTDLTVKAEFNKMPITAKVDGGKWQDFVAGKPWPFTAVASFMGNDFEGAGTIKNKGKAIDLPSFKLDTVIGSKVEGKLAINLAGDKPRVTGELNIDKVEPPAGSGAVADAAAGAAPAASGGGAGEGRLFSDAPIDLSALKSANADLKIAIGKVAAGDMELEDIKTHLVLNNGQMALDPLTAVLAGNPLKGRLTVNGAAQPASVAMAINGQQMDINPLLAKMGHDSINLGKSDFDMDVTAHGNSVRAMAGSLNGKAEFKTGAANLPTGALQSLGPMLQVLSPAAGAASNAKLTCVTARFAAQDGIVNSNGILIDSNLATVAGAGNIDLRQEALNMSFTPAPKDASLSALTPPVRVGGTLSNPAVRLDERGAAANVVGQLIGGAMPGMEQRLAAGQTRVPLVNAGAPGNPCAAALDNPTYAAAPAQNAAPKGAAGALIENGRDVIEAQKKKLDGKIGEQLNKALGGENSPLKGLFGGGQQ